MIQSKVISPIHVHMWATIYEFICVCVFVHACMVCKTITIKEVINLWGGGGTQELVEGEVMQTQHVSWKLSEKFKNWKYFAEIDIFHSPLWWLWLPPFLHPSIVSLLIFYWLIRHVKWSRFSVVLVGRGQEHCLLKQLGCSVFIGITLIC